MPFDDWQFYVVTCAALWGVWAVVHPFLPSKRRAKKRGSKRATLTLEGKKPGS